MTAPDISCEGLAALTLHFGSLPNPSHAVATVLALRAALDAAERERDEAHSRGDDWCDQAQKMRRERDAAVREIGNTAREATAAAAATSYARGMEEAARMLDEKATELQRQHGIGPDSFCVVTLRARAAAIRARAEGAVA